MIMINRPAMFNRRKNVLSAFSDLDTSTTATRFASVVFALPGIDMLLGVVYILAARALTGTSPLGATGIGGPALVLQGALVCTWLVPAWLLWRRRRFGAVLAIFVLSIHEVVQIGGDWPNFGTLQTVVALLAIIFAWRECRPGGVPSAF